MDFTQAQRDALVKQGLAMSDGSYPIRNRQDLARAILAFGRASNPSAVKAWIIKRARALGAVSMLPSGWNVKA